MLPAPSLRPHCPPRAVSVPGSAVLPGKHRVSLAEICVVGSRTVWDMRFRLKQQQFACCASGRLRYLNASYRVGLRVCLLAPPPTACGDARWTTRMCPSFCHRHYHYRLFTLLALFPSPYSTRFERCPHWLTPAPDGFVAGWTWHACTFFLALARMLYGRWNATNCSRTFKARDRLSLVPPFWFAARRRGAVLFAGCAWPPWFAATAVCDNYRAPFVLSISARFCAQKGEKDAAAASGAAAVGTTT